MFLKVAQIAKTATAKQTRSPCQHKSSPFMGVVFFNSIGGFSSVPMSLGRLMAPRYKPEIRLREPCVRAGRQGWCGRRREHHVRWEGALAGPPGPRKALAGTGGIGRAEGGGSSEGVPRVPDVPCCASLVSRLRAYYVPGDSQPPPFSTAPVSFSQQQSVHFGTYGSLELRFLIAWTLIM